MNLKDRTIGEKKGKKYVREMRKLGKNDLGVIFLLCTPVRFEIPFFTVASMFEVELIR